MPHWVEGLAAAYLVATLTMGFIFVFGTDLPWMVKLAGAVLWPLTLGIVTWSVVSARPDR